MNSKEQIHELISIDEKKLSDFQSVAPKSEGKRWGFVGKYSKGDESTYVVKRELGGYETAITKAENDMIVLECLSATLIKLILGDTFAAETFPIKLDCESFPRHIKSGEGGELVTETFPIDPLSNYGLASKILSVAGYQRSKKVISNEEELVALSLVVRVLGITDVKQEHLIPHYREEGPCLKKHTAIIDCAADLNGHTLSLDALLAGNKKIHPIIPKDYGIVLKILNHIIEIESDLIHAVDHYKHIQVSELCENSILKTKLHQTVSHIKECIPQLEMIIQSAISNGDLKLDHYAYRELARLLEKFPEKYRFQILISNLDFFKKEDEEDQEDILKLLPEEARTIFRECIKGENQSTPSITTSYYSFFSNDKNDKTSPSFNPSASI
ncbi:hypothetical protein LEAN103870_08275 [Legionella anisa]|uniref:Protein kinase domain-containing protein n=1 Tax=Legionella anisa TaxID=28082 RepID=A0AAX0WP50_9GAMM|nr:hypothetical protein [Legionella anisa]AWN73180.1 hypothetical protein DLD14_04610 [Legionella anisa]KTC69452.1 hypothetical protein Lani_2641 [Legionella anisa]MCW8424012.1 hypothetical protein [Legionella anisa]MCW8447534.1 hypothetical protein [Legionella anisa]PNL60298.1 hypothetical protein A6J39_003200 [Legionella anisa]